MSSMHFTTQSGLVWHSELTLHFYELFSAQKTLSAVEIWHTHPQNRVLTFTNACSKKQC